MVKNLPAGQGTQVWSLSQEDAPGKVHGNPLPAFLPGEFHGQRSLVGHSPRGHRVRYDWTTNNFFFQVTTGCRSEGDLSWTVWPHTWPRTITWGKVTSVYECIHDVPSDCSRVRLCATLWTVAFEPPVSLGFSRQEYWSGEPFPPPGDPPDPGMEPISLTSLALAGKVFTTSTIWEAQSLWVEKALGPALSSLLEWSRTTHWVACDRDAIILFSDEENVAQRGFVTDLRMQRPRTIFRSLLFILY